LRHGREEPVQDPGSHERLEGRRPSTPCSRGERQNDKPEQHRQSPEESGERNDDDAAGAQHEHIPHLRMVHRILT